MATNDNIDDLRSHVEAEPSAITEVLITNPGPAADVAWRLFNATAGMLTYPTSTPDMLCRSQVPLWLHGKAASRLAGGVQ
ncbi:hypothetical protein [Pseudactinotalea sp. Z1748]|uniref:hypothetical protein n=1 Tax=Pseudactinotalea sp. Z1748 TaxID=3413027 RepID=UPI003C7D282E